LVVGPEGDLWVHGANTLLRADALGVSWDDVQLPGTRNPYEESLVVTKEGPILSSSTGDPDVVQVVWQERGFKGGRRNEAPVFFDGVRWNEMAKGTEGTVLDVHLDGDDVWALVTRRVGKVARTVDLVGSTDGGTTWSRRGSVVASTRDRPYAVGDGGRVMAGDLTRPGTLWIRAPD
jgi:hypothetical protein